MRYRKASHIKLMHLTYDMRIGGTEMVIKNIIEGCLNSAINMSIFCIEEPIGPWGETLQANGIDIYSKARKPGFDINLVQVIRKHLKEHKIDILHCHQYTPWVYGALAAAFTNTKVIFTEHGRFYPDSTSWKRKVVNPVLLAFTSKVTAISQATKRALTEFEFIPSSRIEVIYNGIEPLAVSMVDRISLRSELGITNDGVVLGSVARFDPIKNQIMMINAFASAAEGRKNLYLLLVGDGEMRNKLQQEVDKLKLNEKVIFTGYKAKPATYIAIMDIFLLSSLSEGTSMTLLEAMSLGKPCVVTNAGGNSEVIKHKGNGLVTNNGDVNGFASAILLLIEDNATREQFGKNSLERFTTMFSATKMNEAFCLQYTKLLR